MARTSAALTYPCICIWLQLIAEDQLDPTSLDVLRDLKATAVKKWLEPHHPGWGIFREPEAAVAATLEATVKAAAAAQRGISADTLAAAFAAPGGAVALPIVGLKRTASAAGLDTSRPEASGAAGPSGAVSGGLDLQQAGIPPLDLRGVTGIGPSAMGMQLVPGLPALGGTAPASLPTGLSGEANSGFQDAAAAAGSTVGRTSSSTSGALAADALASLHATLAAQLQTSAPHASVGAAGDQGDPSTTQAERTSHSGSTNPLDGTGAASAGLPTFTPQMLQALQAHLQQQQHQQQQAAAGDQAIDLPRSLPLTTSVSQAAQQPTLLYYVPAWQMGAGGGAIAMPAGGGLSPGVGVSQGLQCFQAGALQNLPGVGNVMIVGGYSGAAGQSPGIKSKS